MLTNGKTEELIYKEPTKRVSCHSFAVQAEIMYWLNPLQEDHKWRIIRTSHQGTTAPTFKETNLDRLPLLSNMPHLYTFTANIHSRQSSAEIQYILLTLKDQSQKMRGVTNGKTIGLSPYRDSSYNAWDLKPLKPSKTKCTSTLPICFRVLKELQKTGLWPMAYTLHLLWENLNRDIVPPWDYKQVCKTSSVPG